MNKVIRNGKVAALYSPGYGAGWSTWIGSEECLYCPELVEAIEAGKKECELEEIAVKVLGNDAYYGGARDLTIEWITVGKAFRVNEYDGNESIEYFSIDNFHVA